MVLGVRNPEKGVESLLRTEKAGERGTQNPEKGVESGLVKGDVHAHPARRNPEKGVERFQEPGEDFTLEVSESRKGS